MSTQLWWPSCLPSFSCTKSCWKFCGHLRSSPDLGTPGDRPSGVPWSLAQQGIKPIFIYVDLSNGFMTFNIDLYWSIYKIHQCSIFYNLNPFTHYVQKVRAWFCVQNKWHALFHRLYTLYFCESRWIRKYFTTLYSIPTILKELWASAGMHFTQATSQQGSWYS